MTEQGLTRAERREFATRMMTWRLKFGVTLERAGELMGCLPQNVLFVERETIDGLRAIERLRRFELVEENMELRRCAVRRMRLKRKMAA